MLKKIVGRTAELAFLDDIWQSKEAEFIAIYGRRRVGKTHLVREYFANKGCYFELTGMKDGTLSDQLLNFSKSFADLFYPGLNLQPPTSWRAAFELLTQEMHKLPARKKMILFFDELPWLATKRSDLMQQLDYFWNTQWSKLSNLTLVVCGSAAAWMLDNLINAKGGLYNRLTHSLLLRPYTLAQTKEFLAARNIKLSDKQLLDIYLIIGGIPHYLKRIKKSKSAIQNINDICFMPDGLLFNEFPQLFASLFDNAELNLRIVREIAKARYGLSIQELGQRIGQKTGGTFTKKLDELEAAGFIQRYVPYGKKSRDRYCRIIDEYTFFYLAWIEQYKTHNIVDAQTNYWHLASQTAAWKSWAGYSFESVCFKHMDKIRQKLKLDTIHCQVGNWRHIPTPTKAQTGAQIDLVIDRNDGVVTLCEMKYSDKKLIIDKVLSRNLIKKLDVYETQFPSTKHISLALITPMGLKKNVWSEDLIDQVITLDDLI